MPEPEMKMSLQLFRHYIKQRSFYLSNIYFYQSCAAAQSFTQVSQLYWNKFSIWITDVQKLLELVK